MKTAFIIAGFDLQNTAASDKYKTLEKGLIDKGYIIAASDITWKRKTPTQYATEFIEFYNQRKSDENIVIGNSFGAVVAFITADTIKPDELYLCSLSPFFKEDRGKRPDSYGIKIFGKRRMEDLWSLSATSIANQVRSSGVGVKIFYGEKEHQTSPTLVTRCKETASNVGAKITELPNAPHSMADDIYSECLLDYISD